MAARLLAATALALAGCFDLASLQGGEMSATADLGVDAATCPAGFANCGGATGCQTDTRADPANCGACGSACTAANGSAVCAAGACAIDACNAGFADCDQQVGTGCESNTQTDARHCGSCGAACAAGQACVLAKCLDRVLVVGTDSDLAQKGLKDVQSKLAATAAFAAIDLFDAEQMTPTDQELRGYAAVLVYADPGVAFRNPGNLGDALATYFEGGGRVVTAALANANFTRLQGAFVAKGYMLYMTGGSASTSPNDSINPLVPNHPLLDGVAVLNAVTAHQSNSGISNGVTQIALWRSTNRSMVVTGTVRNRNRADLNLFPPSNDGYAGSWTGDGAALLKNALLYR